MTVCRFVAVGAVLALAGSSYGFVVDAVAVQPDATLAPSSGTFFNTGPGTYLDANRMLVTGNADDWAAYGGAIMATTFLALDEKGGADGFSLYATGKTSGSFVPRFNAATGQSLVFGTPGGNVGVLDDGSGIAGFSAGASWSASAADNFQAPSAVSTVNSRQIDSIFIGNLALSDAVATLSGDPIYARIDGADYFLPLSGAVVGGYALELERDRTYSGQVEMFIVVPAPASVGLLGLSGLLMTRRRR